MTIIQHDANPPEDSPQGKQLAALVVAAKLCLHGLPAATATCISADGEVTIELQPHPHGASATLDELLAWATFLGHPGDPVPLQAEHEGSEPTWTKAWAQAIYRHVPVRVWVRIPTPAWSQAVH